MSKIITILGLTLGLSLCQLWLGSVMAQDMSASDPIARSPQASVSLREWVTAQIDSLYKLTDAQSTREQERFNAQKEAVDRQFVAQKEAVKIALDAINLRLEGMNELRGALNDQADTFARKDAVDARMIALEASLSRIDERMKALDSRDEGASQLWLMLGGIILMGVSLGSLAINFANRRKEPGIKP